MAYKYCSETIPRGSNYPGRVRNRLAKQLVREKSRLQRENEIRQREVAQIRTMVSSLKDAIAVLEVSIAADLERSCIKDPVHRAFPLTAKTMIARRDNLSNTVAALSDRLTKVEVNLPETQAA